MSAFKITPTLQIITLSMQEETFKLAFFAWIEIPYFIGIDYEDIYLANYKPNIEVQLRIKFRNDLLRIATSNKWTRNDFCKDQLENSNQEVFWIPHYATEIELPRIKELVQIQQLPYLHIEKTETVVELHAELDVPKSLYECISQYGDIAVLHPQVNFFNTEVLPKIASVINTYRVATLPVLRYKISPISENLIETAFIQIQDVMTGKTIQQWKNDFDIHNHGRSMQHHVENFGVQSRFDLLVKNPDSVEFELQFCSSYYLFHMRRWAEAVIIASGVVDSLVREAIFTKLSGSEASELWERNRRKYKNIFNKELPGLGYDKLCDVNQSLWESFVHAKYDRGSFAHGTVIDSFEREQQEMVLDHLRILYNVARWISKQIERPWQLDVAGIGEEVSLF